MRLNDVKDWIERIVADKLPDIKMKVYVGKYYDYIPKATFSRMDLKEPDPSPCNEELQKSHIVVIKNGGGGIKPPFLRYNRINIMVLSPRIDDCFVGGYEPDLSGGLDLEYKEPEHEDEDTETIDCATECDNTESSWSSTEDLTNFIINSAENSYKGDLCFGKGSLQPLDNAIGFGSRINDRIYFETTLQIIN